MIYFILVRVYSTFEEDNKNFIYTRLSIPDSLHYNTFAFNRFCAKVFYNSVSVNVFHVLK